MRIGNEGKDYSWEKIWKNSQGVVSVLLIFIIAVMFLFTSMLIDYARIAATEWRAEVLAQSGIRSVMSAYDPILQQRYQLFAYGQSDPSQIMDDVMRNQLELQATGVFSWVPLLLDSHSTSITRELGWYEEIERQISEDMKYKAPIQFVFELFDKFKPIAGVMKEAAQTTEFLAKLQKLVDKRDTEIGHAFNLQKKLRDQVMSSGMDQLIHKIDRVSPHTDHNNFQILSRKIQSQALRLKNRHRIVLAQVLVHMGQANYYEEDMKQITQEVHTSSRYNSYDQVQDCGDGSAENIENTKQITDTMKHIHESATDYLLLPTSFITDWQQEVELQERNMEQVHKAASDVQSMTDPVVGKSLKHAALNLRHTWSQYGVNFGHSSNLMEKREQKLARHLSTEVERKGKEKEAYAKLKKTADLLSNLKQLDKQLNEHKPLFHAVKNKAQAIANFNVSQLQEGSSESDNQTKASDKSKDSMEFITSMYTRMASGFRALRDDLYRNEYVSLYFTSYDPTKWKQAFTSKEFTKGMLQSLTIHNQEVEYILYGYHNPVGNVAAAFGEIFTMRIALRTMEGLVEQARFGHPLLIWAAAIIYGIEQAVQDLIQLVTRDEIEISRYLPSVTLSYADHLRLFMLVHGNRKGMLTRMLALIQQNTGKDPTTQRTYGETELRVSMPLWFLPGTISWLGQSGVLGGEVEDGRYYTKKVSVFSYS